MASLTSAEPLPEFTADTVSKPKTITGRTRKHLVAQFGVAPYILRAIETSGFEIAPGTCGILVGPEDPDSDYVYWAATYLAVKP